jgi:predicted membrane protein
VTFSCKNLHRICQLFLELGLGLGLGLRVAGLKLGFGLTLILVVTIKDLLDFNTLIRASTIVPNPIPQPNRDSITQQS